MSRNNTGFGDLMVGFLVGGLVGATFAFLIAPKSGEETREEIRAKGLELQNSTEQTIQEARKSLSTAIADLTSRMEELQAQSQTVIDGSRKQLTDAARELSEIAKEAIEEIKTTTMQVVEETEKAAVEAG